MRDRLYISGEKVLVRAQVDIQPGEEITISYMEPGRDISPGYFRIYILDTPGDISPGYSRIYTLDTPGEKSPEYSRRFILDTLEHISWIL